MSGQVPGLGALVSPRNEIAKLRSKVAKVESLRITGEELVVKLKRPGLLTREEVAVILGVSTRQVQRLEEEKKLIRCPNVGSAVRYPISDVLKLASARPWKED